MEAANVSVSGAPRDSPERVIDNGARACACLMACPRNLSFTQAKARVMSFVPTPDYPAPEWHFVEHEDNAFPLLPFCEILDVLNEKKTGNFLRITSDHNPRDNGSRGIGYERLVMEVEFEDVLDRRDAVHVLTHHLRERFGRTKGGSWKVQYVWETIAKKIKGRGRLKGRYEVDVSFSECSRIVRHLMSRSSADAITLLHVDVTSTTVAPNPSLLSSREPGEFSRPKRPLPTPPGRGYKHQRSPSPVRVHHDAHRHRDRERDRASSRSAARRRSPSPESRRGSPVRPRRRSVSSDGSYRTPYKRRPSFSPPPRDLGWPARRARDKSPGRHRKQSPKGRMEDPSPERGRSRSPAVKSSGKLSTKASVREWKGVPTSPRAGRETGFAWKQALETVPDNSKPPLKDLDNDIKAEDNSEESSADSNKTSECCLLQLAAIENDSLGVLDFIGMSSSSAPLSVTIRADMAGIVAASHDDGSSGAPVDSEVIAHLVIKVLALKGLVERSQLRFHGKSTRRVGLLGAWTTTWYEYSAVVGEQEYKTKLEEGLPAYIELSDNGPLVSNKETSEKESQGSGEGSQNSKSHTRSWWQKIAGAATTGEWE